MFSQKEVTQTVSEKIEQSRVLGQVVGKEISAEDMKEISGGDGDLSNVSGKGRDVYR